MKAWRKAIWENRSNAQKKWKSEDPHVCCTTYTYQICRIKPVGNGRQTEMPMSHHCLVLHMRVQILNASVYLHTLFLYVGLLTFHLVQWTELADTSQVEVGCIAENRGWEACTPLSWQWGTRSAHHIWLKGHIISHSAKSNAFAGSPS